MQAGSAPSVLELGRAVAVAASRGMEVLGKLGFMDVFRACQAVLGLLQSR